MKIKISTLMLAGIIYCLAYQCKCFLIIGLNSSTWIQIERVIYIILFLYCRFGKSAYKVMRPYYKKIDRWLIAIFSVGCVEFIYTTAVQHVNFDVAIQNSIYAYLKFLAVYPLLYLFVFYGYRKIQRTITFVCGSSMIYQAITAFLYNTKGMVISERLIENSEWVRNGNIRLGSTSLIWVLFIICFCEIINENKSLKKSKSAGWCVVTLAFMLLVNQSRSLYVAAIGAAVLVYLFHERRSKEKILAVLVLFVLVAVFTQSSLFNDFISSFSEGAEDDTLTGRLELLRLIRQTSRSGIFGFGFVGSTVQLFHHVFYFIDYGLIGDLLQLGIFAGVIYAATGILLLQNAVTMSHNKGFGFDFTIGTLGFWLIGAIGFTVLPAARNFAIPVILAISQYNTTACMGEHA